MLIKPTREQGSISPLIIGALLIGALLLAVVADSSRVFLAHRELVRLSDSTALAAAGALDIGAYYSGYSAGSMPLDRARAWQIAQGWVAQCPLSSSALQGLQITSLVVEGDKVKVTLTARVSEAFSYGLGRPGSISINATATASSARR